MAANFSLGALVFVAALLGTLTARFGRTWLRWLWRGVCLIGRGLRHVEEQTDDPENALTLAWMAAGSGLTTIALSLLWPDYLSMAGRGGYLFTMFAIVTCLVLRARSKVADAKQWNKLDKMGYDGIWEAYRQEERRKDEEIARLEGELTKHKEANARLAALIRQYNAGVTTQLSDHTVSEIPLDSRARIK